MPSCGQMVGMLAGHCLSLNGSLIFAIGVEGLLSERDFEVWIQGKGSLKNDDQ